MINAALNAAFFYYLIIKNPYVYLNDLFIDPDGTRTYARAIGSYATGILKMDATNKGYDDQKFDANVAIAFLSSAAAAQKKGELAFIEDKIKKIKDISKSNSLMPILEKLKTLEDKPEQFKYADFIALLNIAITDAQQFKARLKSIGRKHNHHRDLERNLMNSANSLINSYTNRRRRFILSTEELSRMLVMKFLEGEQGQEFVRRQVENRLTGAENIGAATVLLQRLVGQYINDHRPRLLKKQNEAFSEKDFKKEFKSLLKISDQIFNPEYTKQIFEDEQLLQEVKQEFGIKVTKYGKKEEKDQENDDQIKDSITKGTKAQKALLEMLDQLQIRAQLTENEDFNNYLNRLNMTYSPEKKISYEEELQSAIILGINEHSHMGRINIGTDWIGFSFGNIQNGHENEAAEIINHFMPIIKQRIQEENAASNPQAVAKIYTDELNKLQQNLQGLADGFVIHESTKLYTMLEGEQHFRNKEGFSGRSMNLINFIDSIISFGVSIGVQTDWLKFLAYNIASEALGWENTSNLEKILAIAAGVIMFDDVQQIAQTTVNDIATSTVTNIHFYKLNGVYVPASYFLYSVASILQNSEIFGVNQGDAMTAAITPASIEYTRPQPGDKNYPTSEQDWNNVRDQGKKSNIKIAFGAKFLILINALLKASGP